jgi:hypothetical protein
MQCREGVWPNKAIHWTTKGSAIWRSMIVTYRLPIWRVIWFPRRPVSASVRQPAPARLP